jgi:ABC-type branched-subunit amino acid transport system ATPase component
MSQNLQETVTEAESHAEQDLQAKVLLNTENLTKAFGGQKVLSGVSVDLREGAIVLLRGANGSGKTTLLNILTGNLKPDSGHINLYANGTPEKFSFPLRWWQTLNPFDHFAPERVAREGIGRTWQDIRLFSTQSLLDNLAVARPNQAGENPFWALLNPGTVKRDERNHLLASDLILKRFGLSERGTSSADKVSLGQAKRAAIARAILGGAKILFLDEPLAGLDSKGVEETLRLLRELAYSKQITLVIVEHVLNIPRVLELATSVWTLSGGKLSVQTPKDVWAEITRSSEKEDENHRTWLHGVGQLVQRKEFAGGATLSIYGRDGSENAETVLEVEDLVVRRGYNPTFGTDNSDIGGASLSFALRKGDGAVLRAPNGWGKTSLLEAIAGLIPPVSGVIRLNGQPIQRVASWKRTNLGLTLLQSGANSFGSLTVHEALNVAGVVQVPVSLRPFLRRRVGSLSGGELQKLTLACALQGKPFAVGLLDEPLNALDENAISDLWSQLPALSGDAALLLALPTQVKGEEKN